MSEENVIEIYYRWCELDKIHEYSIVCKEKHSGFGWNENYWIYWVWYKMGVAFTHRELCKFRILPFSNTWDENCKLIKKYKTVNSGTDRVIPSIRNHFKKVKTKNNAN